MKSIRHWSWRGRSVVLAAAVWLIAINAAAQGAVGSGPVTGTLADSEPESGGIRVGPMRIAPGLAISAIGTDDNVFDETNDPKRDFMVAGTPDVSVFARLRFVQVSTYFGSDMQWYKKYESERSIGHSLKGRIDLLTGRVSPFIGVGQVSNRTRPNGEIDVRADATNTEFSGGVAYALSPVTRLFAAAVQTETEYDDAIEDGVSLDQSLNHTGTDYVGGIRTSLTPLLKMQLQGSFKQDEFEFEPSRNGESWSGTVVLSFDPTAVISGVASFGFQDYTPDDPLVQKYRGLTANAAITYPLLEFGRLNVGFQRGIDYSFDIDEGYYVNTTFNLAYTHRLFGEVDLQVQGTRSAFDYGQREGTPARQDTLSSINGNLGYNLRNRSRVALNYELTERESLVIANRNFVRRRIFLSWLVAL